MKRLALALCILAFLGCKDSDRRTTSITTHNVVMPGPQPAPNPVPEPASMVLLGTGLVTLAGLRKKFKKGGKDS